MKKRMTFVAAALALAAAAFYGCDKALPEAQDTKTEDIEKDDTGKDGHDADGSGTSRTFSLTAAICGQEDGLSGDPETKTVNDGLSTAWAAEDALCVFHVAAGGTEYVSDGEFKLTDAASGSFSGTLGEELKDGTDYDWYALYPYSAATTSLSAAPVTIASAAQTQSGNGSTAHLAGETMPLFGSVKSLSSDGTPAFALSQLAAALKVHITNATDGALTVSSVTFTAPEAVAGGFTADLTGESPAYTDASSASSTVTLTVDGGEEIAAGGSADFYIALKPFTASSGATFKIAVNGYEKEIQTAADLTFKAGTIKTANFSYDPEIVIDQKYSSDSGYACALNEQSLTLTATVPDGFDASALVWESSNDAVATVDGGTVTYKGFGDVTVTASLPGVKSGSINLSIPCGLVRETFHNENHYCAYNVEKTENNTSASHKWYDGYLEITTYLQSAISGSEQQRGDIKWYCTPLYFNAADYPIIAVKMEDVQETYSGLGTITQRRINLDATMTDAAKTKYSGNLGGDNNRYCGDLKCSDNSHVFIYNLATQKFKSTDNTAPTATSETLTDLTLTATNFQFKYADIKVAAQQLTYKVYWIQTFKTIDDVKNYVKDVDGLTYEVKK